jgi:nitrogen fixation NifU-like protein
MTDAPLATLYQSLVLDHNRSPRHLGAIAHATHHAVGANPLCGDRLELWIQVVEGQIVAVGHQIEASALTRAMSSMMAEQIHGQSIATARALAEAMLADCHPGGQLDPGRVGILAHWQGVLAYPNRVKSLTLPWATLLEAIHARPGTRSESPTQTPASDSSASHRA